MPRYKKVDHTAQDYGEALHGHCPCCKEGGDHAFVVTPVKNSFYCFPTKKGEARWRPIELHPVRSFGWGLLLVNPSINSADWRLLYNKQACCQEQMVLPAYDETGVTLGGMGLAVNGDHP